MGTPHFGRIFLHFLKLYVNIVLWNSKETIYEIWNRFRWKPCCNWLVDENSEIIEKRTYYMNDRRNVSLEDYIVSSIVHGVNEILQSTKYNLCQIESIGIATPGNPKDGYIKNVVNLGIKEFNIAQKLRESLEVKI